MYLRVLIRIHYLIRSHIAPCCIYSSSRGECN